MLLQGGTMKKHCLFRSALVMMLILAMLPTSAFADESTTTRKTVYKDISANTEIYAVTDTAGSDYPYYGAKWEPESGVLYGRTLKGGTLPSGRYGAVNADEMTNESVISHYYSLNDSYTLEYWSYLYGPTLADGEHAFLVYLNSPNEGADCESVVSGSYDSKLVETFNYLSTLSCPVFLRIGGEMNVWGNMPAAADYKAAYNHIGALARTYASNVALVFSPNYSAATGVDMDSFYPGDTYVDWIGTSLYYNRYANNGDTRWPEFYGVGVYGDAMLNVQQTVNLAMLHAKPIIITEGGPSNTCNGTDNSAWAAERMEKAYSFLTMVYPQIKCIVSSDYTNAWEVNGYSFYDNDTVTAAYRKAIANNPTFVSDYHDSASYYTRASVLGSQWSGAMKFAAYTYSSDKLTATWSVDGAAKATVSDYPYNFTLDVDALSSGTHTLTVTFSNGASKSYSFRVAVASAMPTNDKLYVNGQLQTPSIYKINDNNYFKIRDIAMLLSGSRKQFSVGYDNATACVTLTAGGEYTPNGSELVGQATGGNKDAIPSNNTIYLNGKKLNLTVYKIDGSNYFKLRDLGQALDFYVGWDAATGVTISGAKGYSN